MGMAAMGKLIRCSWGFRRRSAQAFAPPSLAPCTETVSETYRIPVLALPCWVTVVTSGEMLPTSLSYLLTMWSCDVLVCVRAFSQCDRKRWVILRHDVASTASQLVWLQTLALIYQASNTVWPIFLPQSKMHYSLWTWWKDNIHVWYSWEFNNVENTW